MTVLLLSSAAENKTIYEALLVLALVVLFGMFMGRAFERLKLPHITGYIIAGVIIGFVLVWLNLGELVDYLSIVSKVALGFIAYGIGTELWFKKVKKSGKEIVVITILQAVSAVIFTFVGLLIFGTSLPVALILGSIATATAPGPIMLLIKKYKCKGPFTNSLLLLVGLDDAIGIVIFGVLLSVGISINDGGDLSLSGMLAGPGLELLFSTIVGVIVGLIVAFICNGIKRDNREIREIFLDTSIFAVLITVALANFEYSLFGSHFELSPILTPMIMGITFTNLINKEVFETNETSIDAFTPPIMVAFFTIAGAELIVSFFKLESVDFRTISIIGISYIFLRIFGKIFGAWLGAIIMKSDPNIKKYLGISLLPQTGVALGMAYTVKDNFDKGGTDGLTILIVVLFATLVYAFFGPIVVKYSLNKCGEVKDC